MTPLGADLSPIVFASAKALRQTVPLQFAEAGVGERIVR
jgi:hypothetical protein